MESDRVYAASLSLLWIEPGKFHAFHRLAGLGGESKVLPPLSSLHRRLLGGWLDCFDGEFGAVRQEAVLSLLCQLDRLCIVTVLCTERRYCNLRGAEFCTFYTLEF